MCVYPSSFCSESAVRREKKRKSKMKPECSVNSETPVSGPVEEREENASSVQDTVEKVSHCFLKASLSDFYSL